MSDVDCAADATKTMQPISLGSPVRAANEDRMIIFLFWQSSITTLTVRSR